MAIILVKKDGSGDQFQLHKIIISKADRTLLVMKRSDIEDAESYDFVLK